MSRILIALALLVAVAHADPASDARIKQLEARVKQLEEDIAKYREALDFLQKVYDEQKQQQVAEDRRELAPDGMFAVDIAADLKNGQVIGAPNAGVTMVMVFDFACPYCNRAHPVMDELVGKYKGKLRVVLKNMVVHDHARAAHVVGCAAGRQRKFVDYFRALFDEGYAAYVATRDAKELDEAHAIAIAQRHGIDANKLRADLAACAKFVDDDAAELAKFHVNGTPTFFINGKVFHWDGTGDGFSTAIDEQLAAVAASKVAPAKYYDDVVMKKGERAFRSKLDPKP
jgi:protein-disulfide isomerase